jgi:hypothetical protein
MSAEIVPFGSVTVEVEAEGTGPEPIYLVLNGKRTVRFTPEAAERLADNLREGARLARQWACSSIPAPSPKAQTASCPA